MAKNEDSALKVAYNGLLAASFAMSTGLFGRVEQILNESLKTLNSQHTAEVHRKVFAKPRRKKSGELNGRR